VADGKEARSRKDRPQPVKVKNSMAVNEPGSVIIKGKQRQVATYDLVSKKEQQTPSCLNIDV